MATRVIYGKAKISGPNNYVKIGYSGFTGVPSVTATVVDSDKNGANVQIRNRTAKGCDFYAFYNGGLMLTDCSIDWIAVGPTQERQMSHCPHENSPSRCSICNIFGL